MTDSLNKLVDWLQFSADYFDDEGKMFAIAFALTAGQEKPTTALRFNPVLQQSFAGNSVEISI